MIDNSKNNYFNTLMNLLMIFVIMLCTCIFFDNIIFNDNLISTRGDGRLNTLFAEHWFQVFCGNADWKDLSCFYPAKNVLSYSDIMLGFSLPHSLFRILGFDMYFSFKYSVIFIHLLGSLALYFFMKACLKTTHFSSLIAVIGFSFSNAYYSIASNPQLFAESFIPIILICVYYYFINFTNKKRYIYALISLCVFVLLFYTAFYIAFYCLLFALILSIMLCIAFLVSNPKTFHVYVLKFFSHWKEFLLYLIFVFLLMIPFLDLYLPTLVELGGRSWEEVSLYAPSLLNIFGYDNKNLYNLDPTIYHLKFGYHPIWFILFIFFLFFYIFSKKKYNNTPKMYILNIINITIVITILLSFVLVIKTNSGFCLWYYIYKFFPGASAIRAIIRWIPFLCLPFSICFSLLVEFFNKQHTRFSHIIGFVIAALVFSLNHSSVGITTVWNASDEIKFIKSVPAPPSDCDIIFLTDITSSNTNNSIWELQMDAWTIAETFGVKTVQGYSGQIPPGWDLHVEYDDIEQKVIQWLRDNNIKDISVYSYDIGNHEWTKCKY